ncbi:MAG: type II toxin-antitoxin system HicB family antitoxin [Candidatus Omnitrophota bacterium]
MKYAIVIEKSSNGFGAYAPDLPGCVAVGDTLEETTQLMKSAIEFHLEGMKLHNETIPEPTSHCLYIEPELPQRQIA